VIQGKALLRKPLSGFTNFGSIGSIQHLRTEASAFSLKGFPQEHELHAECSSRIVDSGCGIYGALYSVQAADSNCLDHQFREREPVGDESPKRPELLAFHSDTICWVRSLPAVPSIRFCRRCGRFESFRAVPVGPEGDPRFCRSNWEDRDARASSVMARAYSCTLW